MHKEDAEPWMVGNKFIETGYRLNYNTVGKSLRSIFQWHNETSNIWSHLLGSLMFVWIIYYISSYMSPKQILLTQGGGMCLAEPVERFHPEASLAHSYYNHHAEEFEIVESTLRHCMSQVEGNLNNCTTCLETLSASIPEYIQT